MDARQTLRMTLRGKRPSGRTQTQVGTIPQLYRAVHRLIVSSFSMVPVLAVGFDDLQQRVDAQTGTAAQHQEKLKACPPAFSSLTPTDHTRRSSRHASRRSRNGTK